VLPEVVDREIVLPRPRPSSRIGAVPESSQDDRAALPFPTDMPSRIEATIAASDALAAKPRLRQRVEEMLTGILETAEELRRTGQGTFSGASEQAMRVHVGDFVIWYVLDLERHSAKILLIDRASELPEGSSNVA